MRKLAAISLAVGAAALGTGAVAGTAKTAKMHVMNVPLPDGGVARVEYMGDVAPKVTVEPFAPGTFRASDVMPSFANAGRMIEQMQRESQAMMRQVRQIQAHGVAPGMNVAAYNSLPAGANSVNIVSVSNGGATCTRTTEVISQGSGKPPKVTTNLSGQCGAGAQPAPGAVPGPVSRT